MHQVAGPLASTITVGARLLPRAASRAVHDPEDHHLVVANGVVDDIGITQERHAPYAWPLCHFLSAFGKLADALDNAVHPSLKARRRVRVFRLYAGEDRVEFGKREVRVPDLH